MKEHAGFVWSGHDWGIEDCVAWFVDAQRDILCQLNLKVGECNCVARIPNIGTNKFMLNTRCIKIGNEIFCMPCYGDKIWIYNTKNTEFRSIRLDNQSEVKLYMEFCWTYGNKIFSVSRGLKQVIVVDINTKEVLYYPINVREDDKLLSCCVKVEKNIYCTSYNSNRIYQFDMDSKETKVYTIQNVNENLALISYDGNKFWLSGCSKKIYVWDKNKNDVDIIENFPRKFGNYMFSADTDQIIDCESESYNMQLFCQLKSLGKYIWAIPYRTNYVLYIDKDTYEVNVLFVPDEEETKKSLQRGWSFKYFWQYIRDDRYIGVFSLKNNYVLEIDTLELMVEPKDYILSDEYVKLIYNRQILCESENIEREVFDRLITMEYKDDKIAFDQNNIGNKIYKILNEK